MRRNNLGIVRIGSLLVGVILVLTTGASAATGKVIYSFQGGSDGWQPVSDLVVDAGGNLYGTTEWGGNGTACYDGCGTVFELERTASGWKHHVLYSFGSLPDGRNPSAGLIFDGAGNLYGTTAGGGAHEYGTVFELSPGSHGGWTEKVLYSFTGETDGWNPAGDLVFDGEGNLYGTAFGGGNSQECGRQSFYGCGTVIELSPQLDGSWTETTIHPFTGVPDGAGPSSALILDSAGNLYGMTLYGGDGPDCGGTYGYNPPGCGTVYELTPGSGGNWTETILHTFVRGGGYGIYPTGGLLFDSAGNLYGMSRAGGDGGGTVFELRAAAKGSWQERILHIFYGKPDGWSPTGRMVRDAEGNMFGVTTLRGENKSGVVFELKPSERGWEERILYNFPGDVNDYYELPPGSGLVIDREGHLYGTTQNGGNTACNSGCGTVYEVTP